MKTAPILLFVYNRLDTLTKAIRSLQQNSLAGESELFIFSDHPRAEKDAAAVAAVRAYIRTIDGFRRVQVREAQQNMGLASAIITGVSEIIERYGKVIVIEDDLETSMNFLSFMNGALDHYRDTSDVFSVGGYTKPMTGLPTDSVYFTMRATSWGWGTWKDRWQAIDWEVSDYQHFRGNKEVRKAFNRMGSDLSSMLDRQMNGEINSWAIRFCYHQFRQRQYTVFPAVSKVNNIGFSASATHTKDRFNRFGTLLDATGNNIFHFPDVVRTDSRFVRRFRRPYSLPVRITYKLLNTFARLALPRSN